jgi:hypothetical protein
MPRAARRLIATISSRAMANSSAEGAKVGKTKDELEHDL